jgi:rhodanese-related sulfurtransferase
MALMDISPTTTMEEVLRAYPSAKVGLFQRYHVGGCESCSYKPTDTLEDVRRNFNIQDDLNEIVNVIRGSAEVFESLHISPQHLASALQAGERLMLLDARTREEHDAGKLPGSQLITAELTFEILDTWPKGTLLVFYSNNGRRSLDKASYFQAYGYPRARSLTGGLAAWDAEVGREVIPAPRRRYLRLPLQSSNPRRIRRFP